MARAESRYGRFHSCGFLLEASRPSKMVKVVQDPSPWWETEDLLGVPTSAGKSWKSVETHAQRWIDGGIQNECKMLISGPRTSLGSLRKSYFPGRI